MKINNRKELYKYLNELDWDSKKETKLSSVFFLVTTAGKTGAIHFISYYDSYFESPCMLRWYEMSKEQLQQYVKNQYEEKSFSAALEYETKLYRNGFLYEIDNIQCEPFLPEILDDIQMISETECLDWLLNQKLEEDNKNKIKKNLNPLKSIHDTIVFSSKDYGQEKEDAWIYGIVAGWSGENEIETENIYQEFNKKFGWNREKWEILQNLHLEFKKLESINNNNDCKIITIR